MILCSPSPGTFESDRMTFTYNIVRLDMSCISYVLPSWIVVDPPCSVITQRFCDLLHELRSGSDAIGIERKLRLLLVGSDIDSISLQIGADAILLFLLFFGFPSSSESTGPLLVHLGTRSNTI